MTPKLYMAPVDLARWRLARQHFDPRWTQGYAGTFFGVTERTWRRYERGETAIPQWLVRRVVRMRLTERQKAYLATLDTLDLPDTPDTQDTP